MKKLVSSFKLETIKKGTFLLKSGKNCNQLIFVQSGFLRMFIEDEGKEVTQWISTKGYFSTDLSSFIFQTPSRWNNQALVDSNVYTISKQDYDTINDFVPKWIAIEKLFLVRCFSILEDRIYTHLSMTAVERYTLFFEQNRELFNQVPLQYLASMLGMSSETLSRIRKKQLL